MMDSIQNAFSLDGQVALVTGAARGIGRATALALASAGADLALGFRDIGKAGDVEQTIQDMGRRTFAVQIDVSRMEDIRSGVQAVAEHFGRIDILVNNAGIGAPNPATEVAEADFDETVAVNLKGTYFTTQEVGRLMIGQGKGKIINLSSQAGFIALPTESVYCMTKAAISHLTKCFALEWAEHNINVNAVAPTFIKTPGTEKWLLDPDFRESVLSRIPLGRVGVPEDVAMAIVYLASPASSMVTGETLMIDGGWTIR